MPLIRLLTCLYTLCSIGFCLSYIPQIVATWKDRTGAQAISLATWTFWSVAGLVSATYAAVVLKSAIVAATGIGNSVGCMCVLSIAAIRRLMYNRAARNVPGNGCDPD